MKATPVLILALCAAVGALVREPTPDDEALDRLRRYFAQMRLDFPKWFSTRPPTKVSHERSLSEDKQMPEDMPSGPWNSAQQQQQQQQQQQEEEEEQQQQEEEEEQKQQEELDLQLGQGSKLGSGGAGKAAGEVTGKEDPCEGLPQLPSGAIPLQLLSDDLQRLDENKDGAMNEAELQRFFMSVEILQLCSGLTKEVKRGQ